MAEKERPCTALLEFLASDEFSFDGLADYEGTPEEERAVHWEVLDQPLD